MKSLRSSILLFFLLSFGVLFYGNAYAQSSRKLNNTPKAFQTFYAKFKSAVARKDKTAVAALTKFPFRYGWDAGDEGTYSKAEFTKNFKRIFEGGTKLFGKSNPTFTVDGSTYDLTNNDDASHYIFKKIGSRYWFTSMIVEP